jgi:hypothetical protein
MFMSTFVLAMLRASELNIDEPEPPSCSRTEHVSVSCQTDVGRAQMNTVYTPKVISDVAVSDVYVVHTS